MEGSVMQSVYMLFKECYLHYVAGIAPGYQARYVTITLLRYAM
jgi:hypothetical protein